MTDLKRVPGWLVIAAILTALTILVHEMAHYIGAVAMGAQNVKLHWVDVTYDEGSLTAFGVAVTALAGPLFTHALILWIWLSGAISSAALALGLGACSRNIVLLPFTLKTLINRDVSSFSGDEVRAAEALGITPLPFALIAVMLGVGGLITFLTRAYRSSSVAFPIALFIGTIVGIVLWNYIGPVLLYGGRGYG